MREAVSLCGLGLLFVGDLQLPATEFLNRLIRRIMDSAVDGRFLRDHKR